MIIKYFIITLVVIVAIIFIYYFIKSIKKLANIDFIQFISIDGKTYLTWKYQKYDFPITFYVGILIDGKFINLRKTTQKHIIIVDADGKNLVGSHMITYYLIATGGKYNPSNVTSGNHKID